MCPRACVPSVTREARGRLAVLSRPRRRGWAEAVSVVNVAPVDSALSAQRGFHTHAQTWRVSHTHTRTQPRAGARGPGSAWHPSPGCRFHLLPPRGDVVLRLPPTLGGVLQPAALVPPVAPATALFRLQLPCHTRLAVHPARGLSVTTARIPAPCGLAAGRPSSGHEGKHHLF